MSKLPSDSPDAEVVKTVGLSIGGTFIILGIIGFAIGLDSSGKGPILICGFSALAIVGGFILNRKPKWRMKFSIRTMLIAVAVIAIGAAGYKFWVQSTTEYQLEGTISFAIEDFSRINKKSEGSSWEKRFNFILSDAGPDLVNGDESIRWVLGIKNGKNGYATINYQTTANYYNKADKIDDLETQLKKTERQEINSDLHFHKLWIGEKQRGNFKLIKEIPLDKAE